MRGLRTIPVLLEVCRDMEELCPEALLLQIAAWRVPCVAGARGIEPQPVGALPRQLAALMQTNVSVQGLTVQGALTGRREPVYHAAMRDPHTAAELALDEIEQLIDELLAAHAEWVPPLARSV
jgi:alpha-galactosidase